MSTPAVVVKPAVNLRKPNIPARITAVLATALVPLSAAAVVAAPASAASSPVLAVSVSTSNTSATGQQLPFVVGTVYAVTYTLTDNVPDKLTDVSFTDQLPAGLSIAPGSVGTASNCGQQPNAGPGTLQIQPGATSVSESGFTVNPGAGQGCEVELFVVADTAEASAPDTPGSASFQIDGKSETESNFASSSVPASAPVEFPEWNVSVIAPPTLGITYPAPGAHFGFNQKVDVKLTGIPAAGDAILPGNLYAVDEANSVFTNGQPIATDIPGTHTLTVWAQTADGFIGSSSQSVSYTVGSPKPVDMVSHALGSLSFDLKYLVTGRATMTLRYGSTVIGYAKQWVHVDKEMGVWMAPNAADERIRASHPHGFKATLSVDYQVWDVHHFQNTPINVIQNIEIH
jgi:uncharacterized repeat protein (TIGR01451 family)